MASNKLLIFIFFLIIIGLLGGVFYMFTHPQRAPQADIPVISQQQSNSQIKATKQPTQNPSQNDISDQQLNKDSQSIDDSLNSLDTELSNIDSGISDQQPSLQ